MTIYAKITSFLWALGVLGCAHGGMVNAVGTARPENCWVSANVEIIGDVRKLSVESCREIGGGAATGDIYYVTTDSYRKRLVSNIYHEGGKPYFTFYRAPDADLLFVAFGYDFMEGEGSWDYELYNVTTGGLCTVGRTILKPKIDPYLDTCRKEDGSP